MPTRNETLRAVHDATGFPFSFDVTKTVFRDWHIRPVMVGGELAGGYMLKGNEVHVAILPEYRGRWFLKAITQDMNALIQKHGQLTTKVMKDNRKGVLFVERVGFKRIHTDEQMHYYEMSEAR